MRHRQEPTSTRQSNVEESTLLRLTIIALPENILERIIRSLTRKTRLMRTDDKNRISLKTLDRMDRRKTNTRTLIERMDNAPILKRIREGIELLARTREHEHLLMRHRQPRDEIDHVRVLVRLMRERPQSNRTRLVKTDQTTKAHRSDHLRREISDRLRRTERTRQRHNTRTRLTSELQDTLDRSATPPIDRLTRIAHREQVLGSELLDQVDLRAIHILILIDQYVIERRKHNVILENLDQLIGERTKTIPTQPSLKVRNEREKIRRERLERSRSKHILTERFALETEALTDRQDIVRERHEALLRRELRLPIAEERLDYTIETEPIDTITNDTEQVTQLEHPRITIVRTQDALTQRIERLNTNIHDTQVRELTQHRITSTPRERNRKNPLLRHRTEANQRLDTTRQDRRLTRPRTCDAHDPLLRSRNRSLLLIRQAIEKRTERLEPIAILARNPIGIEGEIMRIARRQRITTTIRERKNPKRLSRIRLDEFDETIIPETID